MRNVERSDNRKRKKGLESDGDSDLTQAHVAAASGDVPMLVQAVQNDPSVIQQQDGEGYTPLSHAVHGQHIHAVKRLVKMGADVNAQDSQGRTYLSIAAYQGWPEGVLYLLRKGAKQNIVDKSGRTPLHAATYDVDCRSLMALLKRLSVEEVNAADNEKMTALHWAAFHDRPDHVRQLLNKGADPLAQDIDGKTALHWAVQNGSRSCCILLAEIGVTSGLLRSVDNTNKSVLHLAAAAGKAIIISDLAKHVPDLLESQDHDDRTPLHWSAAMGHANCVKVMLDLGVTPDSMDIDMATPLQYARQAKHTQCVELLEERLGIKQNHKHRGKRADASSGDSRKSNVGFFKGLFSKKDKQRSKAGRKLEHTPDHLPKVSINGKAQMTAAVTTNGGHVESEAGYKTMTQDAGGRVSKRNSGTSALDNPIIDGGKSKIMSEERSAKEEIEHRKKKKHKRKVERDGDRLSSPGTSKTSSTWSDDKSTGENYLSKLRNTHLSPLGGLRPPSISPRLGDTAHDQILPLRRQGELSPIWRNRAENVSGPKNSPVPSQLAKLKDISKRTPTPPPYFSPMDINTKKALPEISPLTQNMETLQLESNRKRKYKSKSRHKQSGDLAGHSSFEMYEDGQIVAEAEENGPVSENGPLSGRLGEYDDSNVDTVYKPAFPRHPSDDAISLYKLRHSKSNHIGNEASFGD